MGKIKKYVCWIGQKLFKIYESEVLLEIPVDHELSLMILIINHHHQCWPVNYPMQNKVSSSNVEGLDNTLSETPPRIDKG